MPFGFRLRSRSSPLYCCASPMRPATESCRARSPSPGSSEQISCIDDRSPSFSKHHHHQGLNHNRPYLTSGWPLRDRLNAVVQVELAPKPRRRHEKHKPCRTAVGLTRQSIKLCNRFLRREWMRGSSPRMAPDEERRRTQMTIAARHIDITTEDIVCPNGMPAFLA